MEMSVLALIIWSEITFLLAGGLALLLTQQWLDKRKQSKASQELLQKVKADRQQRLEEIRQGLSAYGLEGDLLEEKIAQIDKQELKLYQRIVNMFRARSDSMLSKINIAVEASTRPYYELDISLEASKSSADAADDDTASAQPGSELEVLQKKNEELELELGVAMETIGRMLSEYSSLFSSENDENSELDKNKIMQAFNAEENADEAAETEALESEATSEQETAVETAEEVVSDEAPAAQHDDLAEALNTEELLEIDDELIEQTATEEDEELDVVIEDQLETADETGSEVEQQAVENADDLSDVSITDITEEILGGEEEVVEENGSPDSSLAENVEEDLLGAVSLDDEDIAELEAAGLTDLAEADSDAEPDDEPVSKDEEVEVTDLDEIDIEKILAENKEK